ncbi:MAG: hypothetical protein IPO27_08275 [Bacteroidetes bacterium]|nr:hypothetical protein [Bacteroidota bacterium]
MSSKEYKKFKEINAQHRKANIQSIWYYSIFFPVVELLSATAIGLLLWCGILQMLDTKPSFGIIVSFIMYINLLLGQYVSWQRGFNTLQMGMLSSERIIKLIGADEQTQIQERQVLQTFAGKLNLEMFILLTNMIILKKMLIKIGYLKI